MGLCKKLLAISFKERAVFRFDYILSTVFSFLYIALMIFIWKGLYGGQAEAINGITLNSMIAYSIFSRLTEGIASSSVMDDLNESIVDGSVSSFLLLPIGLKKYMFAKSVMNNLFWTVYNVLPSVLIAAIFFHFQMEFRPAPLLLYLISLMMGAGISFLTSFLFGLSCIWLKNSFFLNNFTNVLMSLFSGGMVPIWFFPDILKGISAILPFRYIVFEPVSILLNTKSLTEIFSVLAIQTVWIGILFCAVTFVWNRGRSKLMIQGG